MDITTVLILMGIGICAGILSGFVGVGGGVIIIPALVYLMGFTQLQATGMSLTLMLPPIGVMAFYNYYKAGHVSNQMIGYTAIMAVLFIIGGYLGSRWSINMPEKLVRFIFGIIILLVSFKFIADGYGYFSEKGE
jgi:uncharacterized membrane protein YfcA